MARLIQKSGYIKNGSAAGYMKYIATRTGVEKIAGTGRPTAGQKKLIQKILKDFPDSVELFEYEDYLRDPTVSSASEFIAMAIDSNVHEMQPKDGYMKYIATRPRVEMRGDHGLFSSSDSVSLPNALAELEAHEGNVWTIIYSLHREDAATYDYENSEAWRSLIHKNVAQLAGAMKIRPSHFHWYAAFHNEGHHPHIHMLVWSSDPREGFLTKEGIAKMRSVLTNDIFEDELHELYVRKDVSRKEVSVAAKQTLRALLSKMDAGMLDNPAIAEKMTELIKVLGEAKGKKQYGYLPKPAKQLVNSILEELGKEPDVAQCYETWLQIQEELYGFYGSKKDKPRLLSTQKEFHSIKNIIVTEAENLRLGRFTFEDEKMRDDPDPPEYESPRQPLSAFRKAKQVILNDRSSQAEKIAAVNLLKSLWESNGYDVAAHFLGKLYRDGRRIPYDPETAVEWFRCSASADNSYSQYALGKMLLKTNPEEARQWFERSAAHGNQYAQYRLGKMYLNGEHTEKDIQKAVEYLKTAADQGNQYAQYTLGKLFLKGEGVKQDTESARQWFEQSAAQGNEYAKFILQRMDYRIDPSILMSATRLLHHMSRIFRDNSMLPGKQMYFHIDSQRQKELMEQRYAAGHSLDDHEDTENNKYQQTM